MAETYKLTAPNGTKVEVATAARRDVLKSRGYKEASSSSSGSSKKTTKKSSK